MMIVKVIIHNLFLWIIHYITFGIALILRWKGEFNWQITSAAFYCFFRATLALPIANLSQLEVHAVQAPSLCSILLRTLLEVDID